MHRVYGRFHSMLLVLLCVVLADHCGSAAVVVSQPYRGVTIINRTETSPRTENIYITKIDLTDPGISFKVSPGNPPSPNTFSSETRVQTTLNYLNQEHAQLAFNVHFFDNPPQSNSGTNLTGFAASQGAVYSAFDPAPVLNYAILPNAPVLNIDQNNHAAMVQRGATDTSLAAGGNSVTPYNSLSGSGQIITDGAVTMPQGLPPRPGTGVNGVPAVYFYTDQIAARTSVGLSQDGNTLFFFTVDAASGRLGMTIQEMANLMMSDYGVYNALNLDGGGSTTLALQDPITGVGGVVQAGGFPTQRAVGSSIAIFAAVPEPGTIGSILCGSVMLFVRRRGAITLAICGIGLLSIASSGHAAVMPYSENFDAIAAGGALPGATIGNAGATTNTWLVVDSGGGNHQYQNTLSGTGSTKGISSVQFPALGVANPANGFDLSAVVSPVSVSAASTVNYTVGLRVLGTTGTSSDDSYVADLNIGANGGRIRLVEFTGATATIFPSSTQTSQPLIPNFSISKSYLMDLVGSYNASNALTLAFTVTEVGAPSNFATYTLSPVDTTPRTGQFFGLYDSMGAGGGTMVTNWDNISLVPEPASIALACIAATSLLSRRRSLPRQ